TKRTNLAEWFYIPSWTRQGTHFMAQRASARGDQPDEQPWLLFLDECDVGRKLLARLHQNGQRVTVVTRGDSFARPQADSFVINPYSPADFERLLKELGRSERMPGKIVHLWNVTASTPAPAAIASSVTAWEEQAMALGFYSLLYLTQALAKQAPSH